MNFWRNDNTETFDPGSAGHSRILEPLARMDSVWPKDNINAVREFLALMREHCAEHMNQPKSTNTLLLQEYFIDDMTADLRFVVNGMEKRILNTITGGGFRCVVDIKTGYRMELSVYYHRLVCTNGMIRKTEAAGVFHAYELEDWKTQIKAGLPKVISGVPVGLETFMRSAQVRLGFLPPMIPVILNYLGIAEPYRGMIQESFNKEPGDTLWHFINAFSRAANLVMLEQGIPADEARQKRLRLQKASVDICENVLDNFTQGKGLFDLAEAIKQKSEI